MASSALGRQARRSATSIACDMGGTSFEACLLPGGEPAFTNLEELEYGVPIALTMVDARAIGAGGGSLAWVDAAGILKVGPQSAGADPGPGLLRPRRHPADGDRRQRRTSAAWRRSSCWPATSRSTSRRRRAPLDTAGRARSGSTRRARRPGDRRRREQQHGAGAAARLDRPRLRPARLHARRVRRRRPAARVRARAGAADPPGAGAALPGRVLGASARCSPTRGSTTRTTSWMRLRYLDLERANELFAGARAAGRSRTSAARASTRRRRLVRSIDVRYVGQNWELTVTMPGGELTRDDFERAAALVRGRARALLRLLDPGRGARAPDLQRSPPSARGTRSSCRGSRAGPAPRPDRAAPGGLPRRRRAASRRPSTGARSCRPASTIAGPAIVGQVDATTLAAAGRDRARRRVRQPADRRRGGAA